MLNDASKTRRRVDNRNTGSCGANLEMAAFSRSNDTRQAPCVEAARNTIRLVYTRDKLLDVAPGFDEDLQWYPPPRPQRHQWQAGLAAVG